MKASELMIGDLVYSSFSSYPCKITHIGSFGDEYIEVGVTGILGLKDIASLTPIPLTQEILEKNFPMQNPKIESKWVRWWDFNDVKNGFYFEIDTPNNKCDGPILNMYFKYVHQLQHALKLCGIGKEIIL